MSINVMHAKPGLRVVLIMDDQPPRLGDHGRYLALPARGALLNPDVSPMNFSLKSLMVTVTLAALIFGLYAATGPISLALVSLVLFFFALFSAHNEHVPVPFWKCVCSGVLLFCLSPNLDYQPDQATTIFNLLVFAIGGFLAYSSIRHGHWSTRLIAAIVLIAYALAFYLLIQNAIHDFSATLNY